MTNQEITREFLLLLADYWDDPAVHRGFKELQGQVSGQGEWPRIIEARLMVLEKRTKKAVALLEEILSKEPANCAAALMLARILNLDAHNYLKALDALDQLLERGCDGQDLPEWCEALALAENIYALAKEKRFDESLETADRFLARFGESQEPFLAQQVARALMTQSATFWLQGKLEKASWICVAVVRRFGEATEPGIREQAAKAKVNIGVILVRLGKTEKAIQEYEEVESRFGEATEPGIREAVASALVNKGVALGLLGKQEEAIRVYEMFARSFVEATEPGIREQAAGTLVKKSVPLKRLVKREQAIQTFEEVESRFGQATEPGIREQVARALVNKGWTYGILGEWSEAVRAYESAVERFGQSPEPLLRKWSYNAQLRESLALLEMRQDIKASKLFESIQEKLRKEGEIKKELTSLYVNVAVRLASKMPLTDSPQRSKRRKLDLEITRENPEANLKIRLSHLIEEFDPETQKKYFDKMEAAQKRTDGFITEDAHFTDDVSFLLVLREWNSYTPVIPSAEESDRGGGYYIRHAGEGIVIDPGYDFIENFHRAGGRLQGIDHIIVTHAHDDHTAELEALLMLFQRRRNKQNLPKKFVNLYLSAGVQRKFAGLLNLRDPKLGKVVTLCPSAKGYAQRIQLNEKTVLTVLPAYHDDVITRDSAVGLGFEFITQNGTRKIVFTGDSGLYPRKRNSDGTEMHDDADVNKPILEAIPGRALYEQYPEEFAVSPHLVVAHIGSIKEQEFGRGKIPSPDDVGSRFYPNHLGLLGTFLLLDALRPAAAVVSEFGAELKGFHIDLVETLGLALNNAQEIKKQMLVITGDLTTAYDITNHRFLSHSQCEDMKFKFKDIDTLVCRKAPDHLCKFTRSEDNCSVSKKNNSERAYLFNSQDEEDIPKKDLKGLYDRHAQEFAKHLFEHKLPFHKNNETKET